MSDNILPISGELIRNAEGQYIEGVSGNPKGRPKGAKNRITLLKLSAEESWREKNFARLETVLDLILQDALDGDKGARKMIFDAIISKAASNEDKEVSNKQTITVHRMEIKQPTKDSGDTEDVKR